MNKTEGTHPPLDESPAVELIGKVMALVIVALFLVVVFLFLLHLYAKWFWWRVEQTTLREGQNPRRRRFVFSTGQDPAAGVGRKGLDPSILRSLPVVVFNPEDLDEGLECAVCLSELEQGEEARLLPKCNHGFHINCIDMWFQSHSTCPLCRSIVEIQEDSESLDYAEVSLTGASMEPDSRSSPASACSNSDGMLIIDIPVHMTENLSSSSYPSEELKSPMARRLRSLKRLLSMEKRVCPCSSSCAGAEQNEPDSITS